MKAENHHGSNAVFQQSLRQTVERGKTRPAADQQRMPSGKADIIAVAEACQHIKPFTGWECGHPLGTLPHALIEDGEALIVPVADRQWAAKKEALKADINKLSRPFHGGRVTRKPHAHDLVGQRRIFSNFN